MAIKAGHQELIKEKGPGLLKSTSQVKKQVTASPAMF
jgi:hypothetical protein